MKKEGIIFLFSGCFIILIFLFGASAITGEVITGEVITGKATEQQLNVSVTFYERVNFSILSPLNMSYGFSDPADISLDLNISWSGNAVPSNWRYTLVDLWLNITINSSAPFTPNTTIYPNLRSHNLTVTVENEIGAITTESVVFSVGANNTVPVIGLNESELFVCEGESLDYSFVVNDLEDGGITLGILPIDPFYIFPTFFIGYSREISLFSVVLDKEYVGTTELNLWVSDGASSDTKAFNVTVIEVNNKPDVENISVATVWTSGEDMEYFDEVMVFDIDCNCSQSSGNFIFNLTYTNGSVPFFNITNFGIMNFIADEGLLGHDNASAVYNLSLCVSDQGLANSHPNISICGQDGSSLTVCRNFSITVTAENRAPEILSYHPITLAFSASGTSTLFFNVLVSDPDGTIPDTNWYVDNVLMKRDFGSSYSNFTHTFGCGVSGLHTVAVESTDGSNFCYSGGNCNATLQWVIFVNPDECPKSGGGGAGGGASCIESWGCNPWVTCSNAEDSLIIGVLGGEDYRIITDSCAGQGLDNKACGYQMRSCFDVKSCGTVVAKPAEIQACEFVLVPSCFDGVKNCHDGSCEFLTDCGGPCAPCPTCSDGIQNQGELGIDCGGPCPSKCELEIPLQPTRLEVVYISVGTILSVILVLKIYQAIQLLGFVWPGKT